jgi:hypothetical protein
LKKETSEKMSGNLMLGIIRRSPGVLRFPEILGISAGRAFYVIVALSGIFSEV